MCTYYVVLYSVLFLGFYKWWGCYNSVYEVHVKNVRPHPCPPLIQQSSLLPPPLTKILNKGLVGLTRELRSNSYVRVGYLIQWAQG